MLYFFHHSHKILSCSKQKQFLFTFAKRGKTTHLFHNLKLQLLENIAKRRPEKSEKAFRRAEKIWKRYFVEDYWIGENWNEGFVREAISYDFLTVRDDRRVRNSGIHVVVDYLNLNDLYWGSLTGFSCTVMLFSPSQFSKHQPKRGKSILGSFVSSSNGYLLL